VKELKKHFDAAKTLYDRGQVPLAQIAATCEVALNMLADTTEVSYGVLSGKRYTVLRSGDARSRPLLKYLMLDSSSFVDEWNALIESADTQNHRFQVDEERAIKTVYSAVMGFAICYDLWKPKSRKTPGTFLEVLFGSLLAKLAPEARRKKFIRLPQNGELVELPETELVAENEVEAVSADNEAVVDMVGTVSTDIVFEFGQGNMTRGIVIPAKITTRERIVQPFAHQRILDSAFGKGRYISLLVCVSETQRDDKNTRVNEICVPGTIKLFQKHLANVDGIYYLDPPERYLMLSREGVIRVRSAGSLLTEGFDEVIKQLQTVPAE
jgi:hypothetical protein